MVHFRVNFNTRPVARLPMSGFVSLVETYRFENIFIRRCTIFQTNDGGDPVECTPLRWGDVFDLWTLSLK